MKRNILIISDNNKQRNPRCWGERDTVESVLSLSNNNSWNTRNVELNAFISERTFKENTIVFPNCYWLSVQKEKILSEHCLELGLPLIGPSPESLKYLNRQSMKKRLVERFVSTPKYVSINEQCATELKKLRLPWLIKTPFGANSQEVFIANNLVELQEVISTLPKDTIIESWEKTQEFTLAFYGNGDQRVFSVAEINVNGIFDEHQKNTNMGNVCTPVKCSILKERLLQIGRATSKCLKLVDFGRIDVVYNSQSDKLFVIDVNFLPGLKPKSPVSLYPAAFKVDRNMAWNTLVINILRYSKAFTKYRN